MAADEVTRTQIAENMRFYADMRFKQLTLLLALLSLAGGGVAAFGDNVLISPHVLVKQVLAVAAALVVAVLWIMEVRSSLYWRAHRDAFPDLWPRPEGDPWEWLNATNALAVLYATLYGFWLSCAYLWSVSCFVVVIMALVGIVLIWFIVSSYIRYRHGKPSQP